MTNGSAQPADGPQSGSSTAPTDGPPNEPSSTETFDPDVFPIKTSDLATMLQEAFQQGWQAARMLPLRNEPLEVSFEVTVDRENQSVDVRTLIS